MSSEKRPNILVVMTDQHRLSAVGAYGPTPCTTPNIDQLAAEGARFTNAYCPTSICCPARASFFTGLLPHRHGMTCNIGEIGCNQPYIADTPELLSRRLGRAGYACGYTGKWHLCAEENKVTRYQDDYQMSLPSNRGFVGQDFHGHGGGGQVYDAFKQYLKANGWEQDVEHIPASFGHEAGLWKGPTESTVPYFLTSHTIELIDRFSEGNQPWFIWHNYWGPHEPYFVPEEWYAPYRDLDIEPWPDFEWDAESTPGPHLRYLVKSADWSYWEGLIRHYYAFASMIDAQVGRMRAHLDSIGELDNTYIVFTADHGESLGSHGGIANKGCQPFEEVMKVPLIVKGPDIEGGQVFDQLVANMDIHATACAWAGADLPNPDTQCLDIGRLLADPQTPWRDAWVCESHGIGGMQFTQRALRWKNWIYTWNAGWPEMLFDLAADPHQLNNIAADPTREEALVACRERLRVWMEETRDPTRIAFRDLILQPA